MPVPVHNPAAQAPPHMAHTPDPQPAEPTAHTPDPQPAEHTPAAAAATRPRIRDQIAENPLASLLGALIIVMLGFTLTTTYDRITRVEDKIDARFAAQDARIDARFAAQDAKIDAKFAAQDAKIDAKFAAQDAKIDAKFAEVDARFDSLESDIAEINLKLTALIAALSVTDTVDAALEGRLTGADPAPRSEVEGAG